MDKDKYEYIMVDVETDAEGRKRIKRLEDGSNPLAVLGKIFWEADQAHQKATGEPKVKWVITKEHWKKGDVPHQVFRLVDVATEETLRKFIIKDNATDLPVPIQGRLRNGEPVMARAETVEAIGHTFDFEKLKAEALRRGVKIQAASSWVGFDKALAELEG